MSDSDTGDSSGKIAVIGSVGVTVLIMVVGFAWSHYRGPDGAHEAWLAGDTAVLVEEFRSGEDGDDERFVLHDLKTGKRLADRDPGDLSALFVVNDRLWLHGRRDYGLEPGFAMADDGRVVEHEGELFVSTACSSARTGGCSCRGSARPP